MTIMRILLLIALLTAACAPAPQKEPNVNLGGYPPAFREGYVDGCNSARRGKIVRDEARFKTDSMYASGWRDGLDICGRQSK
jgi:hypothetical protein